MSHIIILKILNVVAKHNGRQKNMQVDYRTADDVDEVGVSEMVEAARVNDPADRAEVKRQNAHKLP